MLKLFKCKYTNKRDIEIEVFFKHVNWYKLLKHWGLFKTFSEAIETINLYRSKTKQIKKVWHNNPTNSLPQILTYMEILPLKYVKKTYKNTDWYFSTIQDLLEVMNVPEREYLVWSSVNNCLGFKRKHPKIVLIKDLSTRYMKRMLKNHFPKTTKLRTAFQNEIDRRK
jgi:hypothetical protein